MGKMVEQYNNLSIIPKAKPDKVETYAGKETARVTKIYEGEDSTIKATKKINKDGSISEKIERRYK